MTYFATGFQSTAQFLLLIAGGVAAVVMVLAVLLIAACIADAAFDNVTKAMARRWLKQGRKPHGKFERIVWEAYRRRE